METTKNKKHGFTSNTKIHSLNYITESFDGKEDSFANASLTHARFHSCIFQEVSFYRAAVTGSIFENCKFINCIFDDGDFEFCDFRNCDFGIERIRGCSFNNSNFIMTGFKTMHLSECTFTGAFFQSVEISHTKIEYSSFEGASFLKCSFKNLDWQNLNLEYVEFIDPSMDNVILPFYQIPYMFGILQYLSKTNDVVFFANESSGYSIKSFFESGIQLLIETYSKNKQLFPLSNICLFGLTPDYNKAFEYLAREVTTLSNVRDFRGIKFCCKLISECHLFSKNHLNKIYKIIADADVSIDPNSAEMKSYTRNIGEIRSILFNRKGEATLDILIKASIGIEYSMRFSNLMHQFQKIAKPDHTDRVQVSFKLAYNSPLLIEVTICGDVNYFAPILQSFMILTGIPSQECMEYPLVLSLQSHSANNEACSLNSLESIIMCREKLIQDNIKLDLLEYHVNGCDDFLNPHESKYYFDKSMYAITTGE